MFTCLPLVSSLGSLPSLEREVQRDTQVFAAFEALVHRHPEQTAVHDLATGTRLSYHDLHHHVQHLATQLAQRGCQPGQIVGVCLPRSYDAIIAILAILRQGAAYLPLDPETVPQCWQFWLTEARSSLVVTHTSLCAPFAALPSVQILCLDQLEPPLEAPVSPSPGSPWSGSREALACVLPTAGTTGVAKVVCLSHRCLVQRALGGETTKILPTDRVAQVMPLSSAPSLWELWATLLSGATLVFMPETSLRDPLSLVSALRTSEVTALYLPAALFHRLIKTTPAAFDGLKTLLVGGDAVASHAVQTLWHQSPPLRFVHVYGQAHEEP